MLLVEVDKLVDVDCDVLLVDVLIEVEVDCTEAPKFVVGVNGHTLPPETEPQVTSPAAVTLRALAPEHPPVAR